ncbi:hypothetical protein FRC01_009536, partial [Tulasnella sp. 417]
LQRRPPSPLTSEEASFVQPFDMSSVVSEGTAFDLHRLAACCAPVPGLPPVVESLQKIHASVERISWNKPKCRKLSVTAVALVFVVCDLHDNEPADYSEPQKAIKRTVQAMTEIESDVREWARLSFWRGWYLRNEIEARINKHEGNLKNLREALCIPSDQLYDKVAALQESLKNNPLGSIGRRRAEEELYNLRTGLPRKLVDLTPAELGCECTRLGAQPEYSGKRSNIWKGRWLDKEDVALIFDKEYRLGGRDNETTRILDVACGLSYLHGQDILHKSMKPSNILVGDDGHAVLSDFSLAKVGVVEAKNSETKPQRIAFRYEAPEVILDEPMSKASDVYSWAMTALEIITGDPPYHTWKSPGQLVAQIVIKNQIPIQSDYKSPVLDKHPEIWELFVRCWRRDPTDRPTAKEIVEELETISDKS